MALERVHSDLIMIASEGNDLDLGLAKKLVEQNSGVFAYPRGEDHGGLDNRRSANSHHLGLGNVAQQALAAQFSQEHGQNR